MRHSCRYLLEDDRRSFSTIVAIALGERAAMIIQEIHHWVSEHFRAKDKRYLYDGAYWIWNSYKQWKKTFPFIPEPSLKKIILGLESRGILVSGEFNKNRGDRTKWYRINYDLLEQTLLPAEAEYNKICEEALDRKQPPLDLLQPPLDLLQPPSDLRDPLCTTDLSTDLSTDQTKNTRADDFFVNSSSTQIQENSFPVQTTPNISETPTPPTPASPSAPENKPKREAVDKMGDRFRAGKPKHRYSVLVSTNPEWQVLDDWCTGKQLGDFKPSLIKATIAHLKKWEHPFETGDAINCLSGYIKRRDLDGFEGRVKDALKIEFQEAIATQQQQAVGIPQQQSTPQIDPAAHKRMIEEARRRVAQQAA